MCRKLARSLALVVALATGLAAAPAAADTEQDKAQARQLGVDGVQAFERGDWSAALARFEAAERLFHAPTHLLFIARSQEKLGQLVAARATYLKLEQEPLPPGASPAFKKAQVDAAQERTQLDTRIPVLVPRVQPAGVQPLEVRIDGRELDASDLEGARVDPGRHRVEARSGPRVGEPVDVEVAIGETREVVITLPEGPREPAAPGGGPTPAPAPESGTSTTTILGISAIGVGVAGLGVGAVLGIVSLGKSGEADDLYTQCGGDGGCDEASAQGQEVQSLDDDAATLGTIGVIAMGAGVAFAATGVTLLLVGGGEQAGPEDARVELVPTPGGAFLRGSF